MANNTGRNLNHVQDVDLILDDGVAATATEVGQVDGADKILDLNGADFTKGVLALNINTIDVTSGDELYELVLQGSSDSGFASDIQDLVSIKIGDSSVINGDTDTGTGRIDLPFTNDFQGTEYRYLRLNKIMSGTTPNLALEAFLVK